MNEDIPDREDRTIPKKYLLRIRALTIMSLLQNMRLTPMIRGMISR